MTSHCKRLALATFITAFTVLGFMGNAAAQEYTYSPDYCDFSATFPYEPHIGKMCEDKDPTACYDLVSFTKVFDMASTVQIDIICNPSKEELYNSMTEDKMKETVAAMTKDTVLKTFEMGSRDGGEYRQAGIVGLARVGVDESMYIAQLWSGKNSIMSVKAQIIGAQMDESDELFAKILRTIGYKAEMNAPAPAKAEGEGEKESSPPSKP